MSEYQYYEFLAIDRPLGKKEIEAVEAFSSRAKITATSFTNEYNYSSFRGKPETFLEKWYDAMVYVTNWGTHRFMFRLPADLFDVRELRQYLIDDSGRITKAGQHLLVDLTSEIEESEWEEGEGWMSSLAPVRAEVLAGDRRAFYLAWLSSVYAMDEDSEDEIEPPVPPGLGKLSTSLKALVDFLRIDPDLLSAAAQASPPIGKSDDGFEQWLVSRPEAERRDLLLSFAAGTDVHLREKLQSRYRKESAGAGGLQPKGSGRSISQLLALAETIQEDREQAESKQAAAKKARKAAEEAKTRAEQLKQISARQPQIWAQVDTLLETSASKAYEEAVKHLTDLRDLSVQEKAIQQFQSRMASLLDRHSRKGTFIGRVRKAGLIS